MHGWRPHENEASDAAHPVDVARAHGGLVVHGDVVGDGVVREGPADGPVLALNDHAALLEVPLPTLEEPLPPLKLRLALAEGVVDALRLLRLRVLLLAAARAPQPAPPWP